MSKTLIIDIDATMIFYDREDGLNINKKPVLLSGVKEAFQNYNKKGYNVILITGRRESLRQYTEEQLLSLNISYDQLIMGVSGYPRYIINDMKPDGTITARAFNIERNVGFDEDIINL